LTKTRLHLDGCERLRGESLKKGKLRGKLEKPPRDMKTELVGNGGEDLRIGTKIQDGRMAKFVEKQRGIKEIEPRGGAGEGGTLSGGISGKRRLSKCKKSRKRPHVGFWAASKNQKNTLGTKEKKRRSREGPGQKKNFSEKKGKKKKKERKTVPWREGKEKSKGKVSKF